MRHIGLLGLDFADADAATAAAWLAARPADAPFDYVVTPNADHLVRLARQPALKPLYQDALLRLMDSRVVARAASGLGLDAPAVATGSDLTALLLHRHLEAGERIAIVGLAPERLPSLLANCGLAPPLHYNPSMGFERDPRSLEAAVDFVIANPARFVFLAVGSPRQEILAAAIKATGQATGTALCIGASLDFLSGAIQRAPLWMQRASLEWLHRLLSDPRRMARRYLLDNPPVLTLLLRERVARAG